MYLFMYFLAKQFGIYVICFSVFVYEFFVQINSVVLSLNFVFYFRVLILN